MELKMPIHNTRSSVDYISFGISSSFRPRRLFNFTYFSLSTA